MPSSGADIKFIFGLKSNVRNNVLFVDEQTIVYPFGTNCVLYNVDQKQQTFMQVLDKKHGISAMAISPNRRYLAVAEKGNLSKGEKPSLAVYDLSVLRKKKVLVNVENAHCEEYVSLAFSSDSKYLAAQLGYPESVLQLWTWDKSRLNASVTVTNAQQTPVNVHQVAFNPFDSTQLSVTCQGYIKFYRYSDVNLKQLASQKLENVNYYCQAWLSEERLVVGSENGKLLFFEESEFKYEMNVEQITSGRKGSANKNREISSDVEDESQKNRNCIFHVVAFSKGIAISYGLHVVHVFERLEGFNYKWIKEIKFQRDLTKIMMEKENVIHSLTTSPNEETIVCSTDSNQIYSAPLSSSDMSKVDESSFELLCLPFHSDKVIDIDVCLRKPVVASCSADRSVKIWNFEDSTLELSKQFIEDPCSISFHPSGHHLLVGFSDKLRFMNILTDDIKIFKELPVKACPKCCFSNGGHLLAAVNGNIIAIYTTTSFENISNLKGHNGRIKGIAWSKDDTKIVSCGSDGAVYEWDVMSGRRVGEVITKSCCYNDVVMSTDGKSVYVVGSDMQLKEIVDSQVVRVIDAADMSLTSLAVMGKVLFVGTSSGLLKSLKLPYVYSLDSTDYLIHDASISRMKISYDEQYLITSSIDDGVIIWKLQDSDGGRVIKKDVPYSDEILISKLDLAEKNSTMEELKMRVEELKMENDYQMRVQDMSYKEKIKELTDKFLQEMESLKEKNETLKTEKEKITKRNEEQLRDNQSNHEAELHDIDSRNNQKLMMEYEKYQELQNKSQKMQEEYEKKITEIEEHKDEMIEKLTELHEGKIKTLNLQIEKLTKASEEREREIEETIKQSEEDADQEILANRNQFEKKLKLESESCEKLKSQIGVMSKAFISLKKEIEDGKEEVKKGQNEVQKLEVTIANLEKDIRSLKKEIEERDDTIQDKEKRIYELKKTNQELEKFKFVLDYNIKELKKQIEPKENQIIAMERQMEEMENELSKYNKINTQLELNIESTKQRLNSAEKEMLKERQKVHSVELLMQRFKTDLHTCVGYVQEPKLLKESITAMYKKHVKDDIREAVEGDADMQRDFSRQREYLERSMSSLIKNHTREANIHKAENMKIMQDNVNLIKEVNDLRHDLKLARSKIHSLESIKSSGIHLTSTHRSAKKSQNEPERTMQLDIRNLLTLEQELLEKNKLLELQHGEIQRLRHLLQTAEPLSRPTSGQKLSPIFVEEN